MYVVIFQLEQEVGKVHRAHEDLVESCERRERLERAARVRLQVRTGLFDGGGGHTYLPNGLKILSANFAIVIDLYTKFHQNLSNCPRVIASQTDHLQNRRVISWTSHCFN